MRAELETPEFRLRLTDSAIAKLLGLSLEEYHSLSHRPIEAVRDTSGKITEFFVHISTNNSPVLLSKLKMDARNYVVLPPEKVYALYR